MRGTMRGTVLALAVVAALGGSALWWGTAGFRAFTSESGRRLAIEAAPRLLPDAVLHDQNGDQVRLSDYRGAPVVMEFVYTTCPDICVTLGTTFEKLDHELPPAVHLLSISFDPADDTERLGWFARRHQAEGPRWRVTGVADAAARQALLKKADVIVLADGAGGFVHNAGLYLVDAEGRLTRVFDPEDAEGVLQALSAHAG